MRRWATRDGTWCTRSRGRSAELSRERARLHPQGNLVRHLKLRKGDPEPVADVVVVGHYQVGMQDQAFLGPESGLAVPSEDGGVELYVATQWLHVDQKQICSALGLPPEKVRLTLAGVGGAFGGREDLSMHVHACLLALRTGKPVKMVYNREESFFGHVHRHPALMRFEHGANRDGRLVYVKAQIYLDGGAYASSTPAVVGNAGTMGIGPYVVPNVHVDAYGAYTNNPPCGAMRGFGSVQAAFAHEAQMDKLAAALGLDPVELRCRNAMTQGAAAPTGQVIDSPAPVEELLRRVQAMPLPPRRPDGEPDLRDLPGGVANTTHGEGVVRGVGYAVAYKNVGFSEGFDDYATARVRLEVLSGEATATVHTASAEVGQGLVTVEQQIVRTELGVDQVIAAPKDTQVGSGGSSSASRQTYVTGGAVKAACEQVRERALAVIQRRLGRTVPDLRLDGGKVVSGEGILGELADLLGDEVIDETAEWRHRPTEAVDPGDRAGLRARAVRVRRASRGRGRGHRTRPGQGRGAGLRPGRGQGHQPAGGARPDPGRLGAGAGAGRDGGNPDLRRQDQESVVHRLPDPHHSRHAPDADRGARVPRPARALRGARGRRAADDLLRPGHRGRHPRRHRTAAEPGAGAPGAHHRHLSPAGFRGVPLSAGPAGAAGILSSAQQAALRGPGSGRTMKAVRFSQFGGPEVLEIVDLPDPHAGPGQVRIAVRAAGVNPSDWKKRQGLMDGELPQTMGYEAAGVVDEVGEGVADVAVGDRVFGFSAEGAAQAELAVLSYFAPVPPSLDFPGAAALPAAIETATRALDQLGAGSGSTLLINGASGSVGSAAVQLAVARGARVIGTASPANHEYLRSLGAEPVAYGEGLAGRVRALAPGGVDVALDVAGSGVLPELIELAGGPEHVVTIADFAGAQKYGVRFSRGDDGRAFHALAGIGELIEARRFSLPVAQTFPLAEIAAAHRVSEDGDVRGKLVLVVGPASGLEERDNDR